MGKGKEVLYSNSGFLKTFLPDFVLPRMGEGLMKYFGLSASQHRLVQDESDPKTGSIEMVKTEEFDPEHLKRWLRRFYEGEGYVVKVEDGDVCKEGCFKLPLMKVSSGEQEFQVKAYNLEKTVFISVSSIVNP